MSDFAREGRTVLFVSHDLGAVARICRRGIWLEEGRVAFDGPVDRAVDRYLETRGERSSQVELSRNESDPVQLVAASVTSPNGELLEAPRRDEPFVVRARLFVREPVPGGLDVKLALMTPRGVRVLEENLSDGRAAPTVGDAPGEWEVAIVVPPVLAAGDFVIAVSASSPYQPYFDHEVLSFRLWSSPDARQEAIDRARLVQPAVQWLVERPHAADAHPAVS